MDPGTGVDSHEQRIRGNTKTGKVRLRESQLSVFQPVTANLVDSRRIQGLEQVQPNIGSMLAGKIWHNAVSQKRAAPAQAISDSAACATQQEQEVVTNVHTTGEGPVESTFP
jgi:hypothetical protein